MGMHVGGSGMSRRSGGCVRGLHPGICPDFFTFSNTSLTRGDVLVSSLLGAPVLIIIHLPLLCSVQPGHHEAGQNNDVKE